MQDEENESAAPLNLLPAVKKYKWHLAVSIPILSIIATVVILSLPSVYVSEGVIMVETQQIPVDFVQSTIRNSAAQQIDTISQRVMTRDNLLEIAAKHNYMGVREGNISPFAKNAILATLRSNIEVETTSARNGRVMVAIGFRVRFSSEDPNVAQAIANDLVSLYLSENVKARTDRASETTAFLRGEAERIREELDKTEAAVVAFQQENEDALPENLQLYLDRREDLRLRLEDSKRDEKRLLEQKATLENQLDLALENSGVVVSSGDNQENIDTLRRQYSELLLRLQPAHPDVVALKAQIEALEKGGPAPTEEESEGEDVVFSNTQMRIKSQISAADSEVETLLKQRKDLQERLEDTESRIAKIPQVERGFVSINRDYQATLAQYNTILERMQRAELAESLEEERKAERFELLEHPILPVRPTKPDRKKLLVLGLGASFGLPFGIVLLLGFLDRSIRNATVLESISGQSPLISIPYITTAEETADYRKKLIRASGGITVALVFGLVLVHFGYMPLGELMGKVVNRLGV